MGGLLRFFSAALQGGLQARQGMLERLPHSLRFGPVRLQGHERCLQVLDILQEFLFLFGQALELRCELLRLPLRRCCLLRQRFVQGLQALDREGCFLQEIFRVELSPVRGQRRGLPHTEE